MRSTPTTKDDGLIAVDHPVPLTLATPKGRFGRIGFRKVRSHVRLMGLAQDDLERMPDSGDGRYFPPTFRAVGRTWVEVGRGLSPQWRLPGQRHPSALDALRRSLSDPRPDRPLGTPDLVEAWAGRPPFATQAASPFLVGGHCDLGLDTVQVAGDGPGSWGRATPVEDFEAEARALLADFMASEVRVVGDRLLVAFQGVHRLASTMNWSPKRRTYDGGSTVEPWRDARASHRNYVIRADRTDDFPSFPRTPPIRSIGRLHPAQHPMFHLTGPEQGDVDVLAHANEIPNRILYWANGQGRRDPAVDLSPLLPYAARGTIGAIGPSEAADVLRLSAGLARAAWDGATGFRLSELSCMLAYVDEVALPVLAAGAAATLDEGDREALGGIAA